MDRDKVAIVVGIVFGVLDSKASEEYKALKASKECRALKGHLALEAQSDPKARQDITGSKGFRASLVSLVSLVKTALTARKASKGRLERKVSQVYQAQQDHPALRGNAIIPLPTVPTATMLLWQWHEGISAMTFYSLDGDLATASL
ncbi:hypothetical protein K4F52_006415 [Lecanicillium sp. MT-2017a]|nr:hypothetical protein K4F52_006415 [Lecanicillium sp. MT-2017a]